MSGRVGVGNWNAAIYVTSKLIICVILRPLHTYGLEMGRQLKRLQIAESCNAWFRTFVMCLKEYHQRLNLNSLYHN